MNAAIIHLCSSRTRSAECISSDLAREENVPTAVFAAKRLEYRAPSMQLVGSGWPLLLTLQPVLIGNAGIGLMLWITRRRDRRHQQGRAQDAQAASLAT